jgi:hypothetical protein
MILSTIFEGRYWYSSAMFNAPDCCFIAQRYAKY